MKGVCQFCKCTEASPCDLGGGEACGWLDRWQECCTKLSCQYAYASMRRKNVRDTETVRRRALRRIEFMRTQPARRKRKTLKNQTVGGKRK